MPEVLTDKDLPKLLDTPSKQVKWAKKLIAAHLGSPSKQINKPPIQGMFSRTLFITLTDGREIVQQFRTEPLDITAFTTAKSALGSVVPDVVALPSDELEKAGAWAYSMTRLPGRMWWQGITGKGADGRIAITKSLGRVLSQGCLAEQSQDAVESILRPHLDALLASQMEELQPYRATVENFSARLDEFARLPLWVSHYDLNEVNVLVDDNCQVSGLVDWELSKPLPFGVGLGRIHTIAGEYTGGEFWIPPEFEVAERGFWTELMDGMPAHVRVLVEKQFDLVQDAVILGSLLDCFYYIHGKTGSAGPVHLKALPKFMTYRTPFVRGQEAPYQE